MRLRTFAPASATIFAVVDYLNLHLVDIKPYALFVHDLHLPKLNLRCYYFFA